MGACPLGFAVPVSEYLDLWLSRLDLVFLDWLLGFCVVTHKEERLAGGFEDWDAL